MPASAPPPVGSIEHPRPVVCADGVPSAPVPPASGSSAPSGSARPARDDVTVGPLTWKGLLALASGEQSAHGVHNSDGWHYVIGSDVRAGEAVTVMVGARQRARAGLEYGGIQGLAPAPAVTFHACAGTSTSFQGAFFISGDGRACVPLDIQAGDAAPRRVVISFFSGECAA